jgi:polyisoprenyl-phosphate glycosyltransferase
MSSVKCSVVIPLFNEEAVIAETCKRLKQVMDSSGESYELVFVDDGSRDRSAQIVKEFSQKDNHAKLLRLSRNFGHQAAISAGLDFASGEAIVFIDADLQDPPEVILEMIKKWKEGNEVVYGKRISRKGENVFKKLTAALFYRLLKSMASYDMPVDAGDFRLIDRKVAEALKGLKEKNRYIRGLISWLGFKQAEVRYARAERFAGETKYPLSKMIKLSFDAITSFSYVPLKLATYLGFLISGVSFIYLIVVVYQKFFTDTTVPGWASISAINLFFNGIVLIILGIFGEYIGRIYEESKDRPLYVLQEKIGFGNH